MKVEANCNDFPLTESHFLSNRKAISYIDDITPSVLVKNGMSSPPKVDVDRCSNTAPSSKVDAFHKDRYSDTLNSYQDTVTSNSSLLSNTGNIHKKSRKVSINLPPEKQVNDPKLWFPKSQTRSSPKSQVLWDLSDEETDNLLTSGYVPGLVPVVPRKSSFRHHLPRPKCIQRNNSEPDMDKEFNYNDNNNTIQNYGYSSTLVSILW